MQRAWGRTWPGLLEKQGRGRSRVIKEGGEREEVRAERVQRQAMQRAL